MIKHFFDLSKTKFPTNIDLMYKLIVILPIFHHYLFKNYLKLPFLDFINEIGNFHLIYWIVILLTIIGITITLFNIAPKIGSGMIAFCLLTITIGCRSCYSDSRLYIASLLILLAIYQKDFGIKLLRWQVIILYFGSGINKLLDPDWQSGIYMDNWLDYKMNFSLYKEFATILPDLLLAQIISWSVIVIELLICFCFTKKTYFKAAIWLGIVMHSSSIVITNHTFGSFVAAVIISYLAFLEWPKKIIISLPKTKVSSFAKKYNHIIDPYHTIQILINSSSQKIELQLKNRWYLNFIALQQIIIYTPIFYLLVVLLLLFPGYGSIKGIILLIISVLLLPIVGKLLNYLFTKSIKHSGSN